MSLSIKCIPSGMLGANTYIGIDEESGISILVDPGGYNKETADYIKKNSNSLKYIILTHGHGDHIGGVPEYTKLFPDAKLVCCKHEKEMLENPNLNSSYSLCGKSLSLTADIWVSDGDVLNVGSTELKFFHTPGHTPGGMCILAGNVLFSGDTLFYRSIGRTDFPGGSFEQIKKAIKNKLFQLPDDTRVLPGHMGETTIGEEKRSNPFV